MKAIATATIDSTAINFTHKIQTRGFDLVADEPVESGGQNAGPAPYEYVLAGLAACTAITLRMYAEHKGWDVGQLHVDLTLLKDREGNTRIERVLKTNATLDEEQWAGLLRTAEKTPVTLTLRNGAEIVTERG
ncbi:OsmC family protein [Aquirhabdus sp.]|uniref:OsmC family protein n=1 Tax=Aquirhabdus sp. TaxID=2824160 RepID=UPI00396C90BD